MKRKESCRGSLGRRLWMGALALTMTAMTVIQNGILPRREAYAAQAAAMTPPVVSTYVMDRPGLTLRDEDAPYMTQLNYAFALIKDGKASGDHWRSIKTFEKYIARHPHILPVLAMGGWGADGFSQAAATQEGRNRLAESALELMRKHGFRGIDIDWEYPGVAAGGIETSQEDRENFTRLLETLRQGLDAMTLEDGVRRYLSIAVGAAPSATEGIDLKTVGALVDQVNVMTYDFKGFDKTTGHHANLYGTSQADQLSGEKTVDYLIEQGIPAEKLILGAAAYGRCWRQVQGEGDGLNQRAGTSGNKVYPYAQIKEMLPDFESHWDEAHQAAYLFNGSQFISYEDPRSARAKAAFAQDRGLMGVMLWEYGKDNGELIQALGEGVQ